MFIDTYYDKDFNNVVDVVHRSKVLFRATFTQSGVRTRGCLSEARDIARSHRSDKMLAKLDSLEERICVAAAKAEERARIEEEFRARARQERERYDAAQRSIEE
jgi:hypothetical protein